MIDISAVKQAFKDASDEEALSLFAWITGAMEVRGLIPIAGAQTSRKRRSDAGGTRKLGMPSAERNISQPSLSGLPNEDLRK